MTDTTEHPMALEDEAQIRDSHNTIKAHRKQLKHPAN